MRVLYVLNHGINIELFSTFAGLCLVALGILIAIQVFRPPQNTLPELANRYIGIAFFVASFIIFILGLLATLILNSLATIWFHNLVFSIIEVSLKSVLLLAGIILLIGGIDALVLMVLKRGLRGFPRKCGLLMCILEIFLPRERNPQDGPKAAAKDNEGIEQLGDIEGSGSPDGDKRKQINQLVNQLKIVFIFMLLTLWLAVLDQGKNITVNRMEWWYFAILSCIFLLYYLIWGRKKITNFYYRWLSPILIVGLLWVIYWISGIQVSATCLFVISGILFLWIIVLLLALVSVAIRNGRKSKLDITIRWIARTGELICWPLSITTFFGSVVLGWQRIFNEGARGWWMEPLLIIGIFVSLVVAFIYSESKDEEHG
ncbi:MAG: hypothetical protein ABSB31_10295 [Dehalococcoidia bacterium]|jgi:hypothetical protein